MKLPAIDLDDTWIVPERGASWLTWGFGTKHSVLRNELASVKQMHGAGVVRVTETGFAGEADALITDTPGVAIGIKTADCLPVLLADLNHRAIAAVHCGWRGSAKKILCETIVQMTACFDTNPADLLVAMGPAIGKCCFEVGSEVAIEFTNFNPDLARLTGKCHLDLCAINTAQLLHAGVIPQNILRNPLCTVCDAERFWSYRREREGAGRMWSVGEISRKEEK